MAEPASSTDSIPWSRSSAACFGCRKRKQKVRVIDSFMLKYTLFYILEIIGVDLTNVNSVMVKGKSDSIRISKLLSGVEALEFLLNFANPPFQ